MKLDSQVGVVEIIDERTYLFDSSDNTRRYETELVLEEGAMRPSSKHGMLLNEIPILVIGAGGGCTIVHEHSAIARGGRLYLAVGDQLVAISLLTTLVLWATKVDSATCFGVYYEPKHEAMISHGEFEMARITEDGVVLWSSSGADIFTEGFELGPDYIHVTDFNGSQYRYSYERGDEI